MNIIFDNGVVKMKIIDKERYPIMDNGHRLKLYNTQLLKEEFTTKLSNKKILPW